MSGAVYKVGAARQGAAALSCSGTASRPRCGSTPSGSAPRTGPRRPTWLVDENPGEIDSTQVRDDGTGRLVRQVRVIAGHAGWLADLPRPADADLLRPALPWA